MAKIPSWTVIVKTTIQGTTTISADFVTALNVHDAEKQIRAKGLRYGCKDCECLAFIPGKIQGIVIPAIQEYPSVHMIDAPSDTPVSADSSAGKQAFALSR